MGDDENVSGCYGGMSLRFLKLKLGGGKQKQSGVSAQIGSGTILRVILSFGKGGDFHQPRGGGG